MPECEKPRVRRGDSFFHAQNRKEAKKLERDEYDHFLLKKKKAYGQYHAAKKEMQDILTAKANIDRLLGLEQDQKQKEKSQEQR